MKSLIISACLLTLINACGDKSPRAEQKDKDTKGMRYLALGDSYTIGESVEERDRWPVLFADAMNKREKPVKNPEIIARTGWTTRDLLLALTNFNPAEKYDIVSLLIGVNNQYQGRSLEEYRGEFRELLLKSIAYAGDEPGRVIVLSTPDWGVTPFGIENRQEIGKEIDQFNDIAEEECNKANVLFIDITPISRSALNDPTLIARDNLHFSGKMHQLWVDEIFRNTRFKL
ncbi:SGNH/GDSL hydrolase family protein [Dyadobacter aurulentus]|uniref:SGNH/GDSL hydrolase family protein n=1 Tax=Dyadobacter sp. UC 10 TaxID=2605428 RepID=UPI0011F2E0C3|nr:SGNH/GDSL hydrolase family protein [Dyadobacter sp. UC 10]KAA0993635.1 SGNH/GDSL hydrolase family protein [Dyadobacter sp. UC 10]